MRRPLVTAIDVNMAVPFIVSYCAQFAIPCDTQGAENVNWWGAWYRNALRAVAGLMPTVPPVVAHALGDLDGNELFVYGIYGDGTQYEDRAVYAMIAEISALPNRLIGAILLPNQRMYRAARQRGWELQATLPCNLARVVARPQKVAV